MPTADRRATTEAIQTMRTRGPQNPAQNLRAKADEIKAEAQTALQSLLERAAALAQEADELAGVENVFDRKVIEGLKQYRSNSFGSVQILQSAAGVPLRKGN